MKIVTYTIEEDGTDERAPRVGALLEAGEYILDFARALRERDDESERSKMALANPLAWFDLDGALFKRARKAHDEITAGQPEIERARESGLLIKRSSARLLAPVPRPGKLIAIGLNYRDHAAESKMPIPESPVVFSKFTTSVIGPDEPVVLPAASKQVDYEAELAVVIGRRAKNVQREGALDYVLGYTNINDVSARDLQFADGQWQRGKSCDTFAPIGESIVTTDEVPDPHKLSIKLRLNRETMQDSNTEQLIFGVPELIAFLSETITLEPGDVIATGTPPGVGFARQPPVFLKHGDVMEVEIEKLGTLHSPIVAAHEETKSTASGNIWSAAATDAALDESSPN
jgi:2-keto-4-pentenoate hydratase/2-oxohepta-3-ene-1,7-dioic acid hydratase in catechol pathway